MIVKTIYCPEIIYSTNYPYFTSNGLVVWLLDSQSRVPRFINTGWLQADSDFDPSLVNQMNIRNSWNLVTQLHPYKETIKLQVFLDFLLKNWTCCEIQELFAFAYNSKIWYQDLRKVTNFNASKTLKLYNQNIPKGCIFLIKLWTFNQTS